ncbi:MAG: hypothetical protein KUA30_11215, partial [Candidatus Desulforudis sp.]|nr:hypothetical protein [Desulforudis sp.]
MFNRKAFPLGLAVGYNVVRGVLEECGMSFEVFRMHCVGNTGGYLDAWVSPPAPFGFNCIRHT